MNKSKQTSAPAFGTIAKDVRTLMTATRAGVGDGIGAARERLSAALEDGQVVYQRARKAAIKGTKTADKLVRENPYRSIGIAFGAGALLTWLLSRNRD